MHLRYLFLLTINIYDCRIKGGNVSPKNDKFVDIIKKNLRRNNDDYNEIINRNQVRDTSIKSVDMTITKGLSLFRKKISPINKTLNKIKTKINNRRTNDGQSWEFEYSEKLKKNSIKTTKPKSDITTLDGPTATEDLRMRSNKKVPRVHLGHVKKNLSRLNHYNELNLPAIKTSYSGTPNAIPKLDKIPKFINKKKIDKFSKFMEKNRGLLKDFISSKFDTQTSTVSLRSPSNKIDPLKLNVLRNINNGEFNGDYDKGQLPYPKLLDMAPAKGGRIHRLRIKGRLCQRHILLPEGPKYDSKGRWYVPAPELLKGHYDSTPRPRLILPRCCNCCKKSVLGCE